jgi:hypothetical protein
VLNRNFHSNVNVLGRFYKQFLMSLYRSTLFGIFLKPDIWMEIPIQHDVYIWANYSVSSYLKFIPICWNVLIWLKYDFMHIFMHHLCNMLIFACPIIANSQCWLFALRANTGQISVFALKYPYLPSNIRICPHISVTFSKHWLLYCKKDLWTDKLRK